MQEQMKSESIVEILKNEHNLVRTNIGNLLDGATVNQDLFSQTTAAVTNHFSGEESLVFPKFESMPESRKLTFELFEEHDVARKIVSDIDSSSEDTDKWLAKLQVLSDLVNAHFTLEEKDVFPKAQELLSSEVLDDLGRRYKNKQF